MTEPAMPQPERAEASMTAAISSHDRDGMTEDRASANGGSDYAQLLARVQDAGLLDRRPGYYTAKITLTVLALAGGWVAFIMIGRSWWQLATAAVLAFLHPQVAFVGHDAGHKQVFRTRQT